MVDSVEYLVRFVLLPGQRHDMVGVDPLIQNVCFDALLGDKAFDVDWPRAESNRRGAIAAVPPKANRRQQFAYDTDMYRWRHLIKNGFAKIKDFRGIAARDDETDTSFRVNLTLVATHIAMR